MKKEATASEIRKPVLVIRLSTNRPEAVETGFTKVVGIEKRDVLTSIEATTDNAEELLEKSFFGNGDAAEKIVTKVRDNLFSKQEI